MLPRCKDLPDVAKGKRIGMCSYSESYSKWTVAPTEPKGRSSFGRDERASPQISILLVVRSSRATWGNQLPSTSAPGKQPSSDRAPTPCPSQSPTHAGLAVPSTPGFKISYAIPCAVVCRAAKTPNAEGLQTCKVVAGVEQMTRSCRVPTLCLATRPAPTPTPPYRTVRSVPHCSVPGPVPVPVPAAAVPVNSSQKGGRYRLPR